MVGIVHRALLMVPVWAEKMSFHSTMAEGTSTCASICLEIEVYFITLQTGFCQEI